VAHTSNTGGAKRSAWKSVVPTPSSQAAQTIARAVAASLARLSKTVTPDAESVFFGWRLRTSAPSPAA
jgi:hypothetical protein